MAFLFEGFDIGLSEGLDLGGGGFHLSAKFLAHCFEVGLDFLGNEAAGIAYEFEIFDIDFCEDYVFDAFDLGLEVGIEYGDEYFFEGLADADFFAFAEREDKRRDAGGVVHALFEGFIYAGFVASREESEMHGVMGFEVGDAVEVAVEAVAEERRDGGHEFGDGNEAGV